MEPLILTKVLEGSVHAGRVPVRACNLSSNFSKPLLSPSAQKMAYTIHEIPVFIAMGVVGKDPSL